jgi:calcineurin-like phosphoesterase family protein
MDEALIQNWNNVVSKNDTIYHLGDFSYKTDLRTSQQIFDRLNGKKFLIFGNHDKLGKKLVGWEDIDGGVEFKDNGRIFFLSHFPVKSFPSRYVNLHGHCHNSLPRSQNQYDMGVDVPEWNYTPVSFDTIRERLQNERD